MPAQKALVKIDGGHFGLLYHSSELFDRASKAQADFVIRTVRPTEIPLTRHHGGGMSMTEGGLVARPVRSSKQPGPRRV